eukprot:gene9631-10619_t
MSQLQAVSIKPVAEFRPDAEVGASLATRWKDWLDDFEMFLLASGITDKTRKRALLLYQAGPRVREIFKNLTEVGGTSDFDVAKNKLTEYFEPQKNRRYEVYRFRQATQEQTETLDQFHTRLRTMAQTCEFHDAEFEIEEQIIIVAEDPILTQEFAPQRVKNAKFAKSKAISLVSVVIKTQATNSEVLENHKGNQQPCIL